MHIQIEPKLKSSKRKSILVSEKVSYNYRVISIRNTIIVFIVFGGKPRNPNYLPICMPEYVVVCCYSCKLFQGQQVRILCNELHVSKINKRNSSVKYVERNKAFDMFTLK